MSSGFVSERTLRENEATQNAEENEDWAAAKARVAGLQERNKEPKESVDDRSLFDRLQENKLKKEEARMEAAKFSNLIRRLDDDEVDFLADVQEQKRREDREKREEMEREMDAFRRARYEAEQATVTATATATATEPPIALKKEVSKEETKKRKKENVLVGLVVKKAKGAAGPPSVMKDTENKEKPLQKEETPKETAKPAPIIPEPSKLTEEPPTAKPAGLSGLIAYGSDSDSD
ncbi:hypothetical protein SAICODRAFT_25499 [Saitoella complicata NRRL Y-17804]|uniref:FAM192A/Fyv6 N-terminal domain-containing protein n=1 Tax=Saitoella complicata (strain BCRC 22490 / CBS 7301 / JCM 7358 / NBRC 10748 / NRRL Y-17804) TaxID=698492 RepID=A0A0E9NGS4_SAICN|nr:uncharacterized protein SAICODRAFT_25499 [Saitoella complicata NRRL Y-17804]ODQ52988.1 hypothetical protein SAICODRAFT_25499 [Saitoella complicata NRRL Y-17804]GAO49044.1 hypothetical protein G7K_3205-t1 [Saitoella complicata NRRL Y-17804]